MHSNKASWSLPSARVTNAKQESCTSEKKVTIKTVKSGLIPSPGNVVKVPVQADAPRVLDGLLQFPAEGSEGHLFGLAEAQSIADVPDVLQRLQLRDATGQHHGEQVDEQIPAVSQLQKCLLTQLPKPDVAKDGACIRTL